MPEFLTRWLNTYFADNAGFMPHGACYYWQPEILWLHVLSDVGIGLAYFSIPLFLIYFARKRQDLVFREAFIMFGLFIFSCGVTHFGNAWTVWDPQYGITGWLKAITAVISLATAAMLVPIMPRALNLPSHFQLQSINHALEREVAERREAEAALRKIKIELEERVEARNQELLQINHELRREIKERREAEAQVRYQAHLFANISDAIISTDTEFRIESWNKAAEEMYGWSAEEAVGQHVGELLHPGQPNDDEASNNVKASSDGVAIDTRVDSLFSKGFWRGEEMQKRQDGQTLYVLSTVSLIRSTEGLVTGMVAVNRDISERKRTEEALAEKTRDLEESNRELEQFAYIASHDLQAPLRAISGYVQLLERRYQNQLLDDKAQELIGRTVNATTRMKNLINDLLAFSRVGTQKAPFERVSMNQVLQDVEVDFSFMLEQAEGRLSSDDLPKVYGDEGQLYQLLQNLIGNALKFRGEEPPEIYVGVEKQGRNWLFSVSDNGLGIDSNYQEQVFTIFQRLHSQAEYSGTGIGLALCKKIVERHQGRIWFESEPGQGTTFYFTLPRMFL